MTRTVSSTNSFLHVEKNPVNEDSSVDSRTEPIDDKVHSVDEEVHLAFDNIIYHVADISTVY